MNILHEQDFRCAAAFPDGSGRVMISNMSTNKLLIIDNAGNVVGSSPDECHFDRPEALAFDNNTDELYVSDRYNHCVKVLDYKHGFKLLRIIGGNGELEQPIGIALDPKEEKLYVADSRNNRIVVFTRKGELVNTIGGENDKLMLSGPSGIALYQGMVIVSEWGNDRVHVFKNGKPLLVAHGFPHGQHLTVDPRTGTVYVALFLHRKIRKLNIFVAADAAPQFTIYDESIGLDFMPNGLLIHNDHLCIITKTFVRRVNVF